MKVLIISTLLNPTPPVGYGGIERFVHDLATEFHLNGHNVLVLRDKGSSGGDYRSKKYGSLPQLCNNIPKVINNFNPDIIQVNIKDRPLVETLSHTNKPIVFTFHNNIRNTSSFVNVVKSRVPNFHFVVVSKSLKRRANRALEINDVSFPKDKIKNLGCGLNIDYMLKKSKEQKRRGSYYIYIGSIVRYKGVLDIIKSFRKLDENLLVVGPYNRDPLEKVYCSEVKELIDLLPNVSYHGETKSDEEKINLLLNSKGLIIATGYDPLESDCHEAFGLVMLEANACGKPVIGYSKGNTKDYICDGVNGYKFKKIKDIKGVIKNLEKENLSKSCVNYARKFHIKHIAQKYTFYFNSLTN